MRSVNGPPTEIQLRPPGPDRGQALAPRLFLILYLLSIVSVLYIFRAFITDFILSLLLVVLAYPRYRHLTMVLGHRRWTASFIMTTAILIMVAVPSVFIVASLSSEIAMVYELTRESFTLHRLEGFLMGESWLAAQARSTASVVGWELTEDNLRQAIYSAAGSVASFLYEQMNALLANLLSAMFHALIILVTVFYLFVDGERLKQWFFRLSPLPIEQEEMIGAKFSAVGRAILFGNGIGSVLQGVLGGVAMWAAGLPSPVLWGTVMSVFAFLPVVGISFVVLPATVYLILIDRLGTAVVFFVFCGAQALLMENLVKTRLIGSHMQMHDLLIFMSIVGGLGAFGILGLLYGPLLVTLFLTMCELFEADYKDRLVRGRRSGTGDSQTLTRLRG
jgi:predicted PurR-regulated permease PerM